MNLAEMRQCRLRAEADRARAAWVIPGRGIVADGELVDRDAERGENGQGIGLGVISINGAPRLRPVPGPAAAPTPRPRVVHLAQSLVAGPEAGAWLGALAGWGHPLVLVLGPRQACAPGRTEAERRIGLLAIEQNAWALTDRDPRFEVAASRTELDWSVKSRLPRVWAPTKMVMDSQGPGAPDASDPAALAAWLATEIAAELLVFAGDPALSVALPGAVTIRLPSDLPA